MVDVPPTTLFGKRCYIDHVGGWGRGGLETRGAGGRAGAGARAGAGLLEADGVWGGHAVQEGECDRDDGEGGDQADGHQGVVVVA